MTEMLVSFFVRAIDKVWPVPVFLLALAFVISTIGRWAGVPSTSKALNGVVFTLILLIPFGTPALFIFGSSLTAPLVYHYGVPGQAVIVSSKQTSNIYNNRPVIRYAVTLQKADGEQVETHFNSSDFNIYPRRNAVRYPAVGQPFEVRYLANRPQSFVILMEDEGPKARLVR